MNQLLHESILRWKSFHLITPYFFYLRCFGSVRKARDRSATMVGLPTKLRARLINPGFSPTDFAVPVFCPTALRLSGEAANEAIEYADARAPGSSVNRRDSAILNSGHPENYAGCQIHTSKYGIQQDHSPFSPSGGDGKPDCVGLADRGSVLSSVFCNQS